MIGIAALSACYTTPAFREPAVRVAPAYGVAAPDASPRAAERSSVQVVQGVASAVPSVHYRQSDAGAPFWRELGDPTLAALITEALRASPDIRIAEARLAGARAARRLAAFDLGPTVNGGASAFRSQQSVGQIPGLTNQLPSRDLYDFGFDASWELDIFGRARRSVGAQTALAASATYALEDVQVSLAAEVARSYFELRGAERQLAVARRNAANQRHTVSLTEDRLTAGRGTAFDTERARSVLQLTLAGIPSIESGIAAQRYRLATLLGRTAEELPPAVYTAADLPPLPDSLDVGSPTQLIRHRPDVLRAERLVAASALFVGAARADYLPRITLGGSAGYTATRFQSLTSTGTSRFLFGPVVSVPLLDIGRVRQRVAIAGTREDEARAEYDATVLQAIEEAETSLVAYDRAHARVGVLTEAVRASARAAELAQQRFEAGLTDFFQVLDAQRTLLDAETQLAVAHTSAAISLVVIYKSVGGTWKGR
jgi:NodT family efflux transporter outer membrane factor (OMF) lipoprotein